MAVFSVAIEIWLSAASLWRIQRHLSGESYVTLQYSKRRLALAGCGLLKAVYLALSKWLASAGGVCIHRRRQLIRKCGVVMASAYQGVAKRKRRQRHGVCAAARGKAKAAACQRKA